MIYLTRTTIEPDGTRTIEIAALEDSAPLTRYEAQGFVVCSYDAYSAAWCAKHTRVYERLMWEAEQRPLPIRAMARRGECPECKSMRTTRCGAGTWECRGCTHQWSER